MFEVMVMVLDSLRGQKNVFNNEKSFQYLVALRKKNYSSKSRLEQMDSNWSSNSGTPRQV
jgi:hypothetical protein